VTPACDRNGPSDAPDGRHPKTFTMSVVDCNATVSQKRTFIPPVVRPSALLA
jgi:hypothetical protein